MTSVLDVETDVKDPFPRDDIGDRDALSSWFDREIAKTAERLLLANRGVDYRTNVFASKVTPGKIGEKPVIIEMIDATTKAVSYTHLTLPTILLV